MLPAPQKIAIVCDGNTSRFNNHTRPALERLGFEVRHFREVGMPLKEAIDGLSDAEKKHSIVMASSENDMWLGMLAYAAAKSIPSKGFAMGAAGERELAELIESTIGDSRGRPGGTLSRF